MQALRRYTPNGGLAAILIFAIGICAAAVIGCAATGTATVTPAQQALNLTAQTCKDNDAAMVAADSAVKANVLKGKDAQNAVTGLSTIQAACVSTLATLKAAAAAPAAAPATTGATK